MFELIDNACHVQLFLTVTVSVLDILFNKIAIAGRQFFFDCIVSGITTAITQTTPGTGRRIVIGLLNDFAIRIVAGSTFLTFALTRLGFGLLLTRSFFAGLSRAAFLAVGTAFLFFLFLDQLCQHGDNFVLLLLSRFVRLGQFQPTARIVHSL